MLSEEALAYLATRTYRTEAKCHINVIPFGGIYWQDEYPFFGKLFEEAEPGLSEEEEDQIWHMMYLRSRLWRGESLTDKDRQLWDYVYAKVPTWALFQRIQISEEDRQWQEFGQQLADKFDACWEAFPEEFEVCQEGTDEDDK